MKTEFRRNLPHFYSQDAIYDISFRLVNTVPRHLIQKYVELRDQYIRDGKKNQLDQLYYDRIERILDETLSERNYLEDELIRNEVISAINYHNGKLYSLIAYCIMPNHVHLIINTFGYPNTPLGEILKSIKQFSATKSNKILKRRGQFWHHESYDHMIKTRNELAAKIDYIKNNPVKGNLVKYWKDWGGTFVNPKYL